MLDEFAIVQRGGSLTHTAVPTRCCRTCWRLDDNRFAIMSPLDGITVLDLTRVLSGPYCTMLLADMGARVIKVEQPGKGDDTRGWGPPFIEGESAYFLSINRNKESITLDFKHPDGRAVLDGLLAKSDVLVENFRPDTLKKVGLDYQSLAPGHPRLIYCSVSGFGQTGPRSQQPGYDAVMQGEGGLMSITGAADGPPYRLGVAIADIVSGMFAAQGITAALFARQRTGRGQQVDVAMLDSVIALLTYQAGNLLRERQRAIAPRQPASEHRPVRNVRGVGWIVRARRRQRRSMAALPRGRRAARRWRAIRHESAAGGGLRRAAAVRLRSGCAHPRQHWIERLTAASVPCGSVRDLQELFADPQIAAREMIAELEHATIGPLKMLGVPVKLSDTAGSVRTPPPTLGQHTDAVLARDLGYSADAIAGLRRQNVI